MKRELFFLGMFVLFGGLLFNVFATVNSLALYFRGKILLVDIVYHKLMATFDHLLAFFALGGGAIACLNRWQKVRKET